MTVKALDSWFSDAQQDDPVHPEKSYKNEQDFIFLCRSIRDTLRRETNDAVGKFCYIDRDANTLCRVCNSPIYFYMHVPNEQHLQRYLVKRSYKRLGNYGICRNKLCRFVADEYPKIAKSKSPLPMALVLLEALKKKNAGEKLEKLFEAML